MYDGALPDVQSAVFFICAEGFNTPALALISCFRKIIMADFSPEFIDNSVP
jgi:hypothetical protein